MKKRRIRLLAALLALALVLNFVLIDSVTVLLAENVDTSVRYTNGLVVDGSGGWNSGGGDQYLLQGEFDTTVTFENTPFIRDTEAWSNFVFEIFGGANTRGFTFRADNYGWAYGEGSQEPALAGSNTWNNDWEAFKELCRANPIVKLNLKKTSDTVVTVYMEFMPSIGKAPAASQTYTVTYPDGVPDSMRVQVGSDGGKVRILERRDNTLVQRTDLLNVEGFITAKTENIAISGSSSGVVYTFHNSTLDSSQNYHNFIVEVEGDGLGITARADIFGWGYNDTEPGLTWESDIGDWAIFRNDMLDADVIVAIDRIDSVITFTYDIASSTGNTYHIVGKTAALEIPDVIYAHLSGEKVKLTNIEAAAYNLVKTADPSIMAEYTRDDLTVTGAIGSAATGMDELLDYTRIVYTFHNTTLAEEYTNWFNFVVELWGDDTFGITARADAYDWGYNGLSGNRLLMWEQNIDDNFASAMADADVTVTIDRTGSRITLTYNIVSSNGKTYRIIGSTANYELPTVVYTHLTGEQVKLTDIKVTIYKLDEPKEDDDDYDASTDTDIIYGALSDRVTVHDPSIVKDGDTYYIFGSHMAWAKSTDLIHWQTFTNNINRNYKKLFAEPAKWSARGSAVYDLSGNLWAPDVIWNDTMKKWCMYMSVNGDNWYTSTVLLTADNIEGPYTYVGPVVYSGFMNEAEAKLTDFYDVIDYDSLGSNEKFPSRYTQNRNGVHTYGMNAIDPCVTYDEEGNLWMTYGSWFGGIYMLKLDNTTGLRDYSYTYSTVANVSDEYQGIKLAGGDHASGEASYLEKIGDYWYLFMSYGGLTAAGGYNMRVFRSEDIEGPYVDLSGDSAIYTSAVNNINGTVGNRLMTYYQWNYMDNGQVAQGHNSAFVDDDGKAYVVYHTRFNDGTEGHQVRVHQLFQSEDGWLVAAPFEYANESLTAVNRADIAGKYEVLFHTGTNYANTECVTGQTLIFEEDGTLSGAIEGTWVLDGYYVTLTSGSKTYKGVFVKQKMEESDQETLCFTVIGSDEISVWGYKYPYSVDEFIEKAAEGLGIPIGTFAQNITLPSVGLYDTTVTWSSGNTAIITNDGKVTVPAKDTVVTLFADITYENTTKRVEFPVKVYSGKENERERYLIWEYFTGENRDLSGATEGSIRFPNPFNADNVLGISIYNGVSIEFDVALKGSTAFLSNILSMNAGAKGGLYFTGGSYLGYNATGGFFDANVDNSGWTAGTDFIGSGAKIRIDLKPTGYEVYVNGELAYTQADVGGKVPGSSAIDSYTSVLNYLRNTATYLNFGWGSWWDGGFSGTISNVKLYAEPIDFSDTSGYVYYEDYNNTADTGWTSPNAQNDLSIKNDGDSRRGYVNYAADTSVSGNRGAYTNFPAEANLSGRYVVEADIRMTPGNVADRSVSQFAITGADAAYGDNNYNNGIISGYILKLSTNAANSTTYYINDGAQSVTIPSDAWVHVKAVVSGGTNVDVYLTINGVTHTFSTKVNGSGELKGLYILRGRGSGAAAVDNIAVSEGFHYGKPEFIWSEDGKTARAVFPCDEGEEYNETVKATVTGEVKIAATCKEMGTTTYTAVVRFNGETYIETRDIKDIPAAGHTEGVPVRVNEKAASCTAEGSYEEVVYCSVCGTEMSSTVRTTGKLAHTPGAPVIENRKDATATADGSYDEVVYCTVCGKELTRTAKTIPAVGQVGSIRPKVEIGAGAPSAVIHTDVEKLKNAVLNKEEKEALENGKNVEVVLHVKIKNAVEAELAAAIKKAAEGKYIIGHYLELDLYVYIDNALNRTVALTNEPIQITVDIPGDIFAKNREYVIIREHGGVTDILKDIDNDPRTITFETDRFSTYVIAYLDHAEAEVTTGVTMPFEPTAPAGPDNAEGEATTDVTAPAYPDNAGRETTTDIAAPSEPTGPAGPGDAEGDGNADVVVPSESTVPAVPDDNIPNTGNNLNAAVCAAVMLLSAIVLFGAVYIRRRTM